MLTFEKCAYGLQVIGDQAPFAVYQSNFSGILFCDNNSPACTNGLGCA